MDVHCVIPPTEEDDVVDVVVVEHSIMEDEVVDIVLLRMNE